jgi:hypothetical protein
MAEDGREDSNVRARAQAQKLQRAEEVKVKEERKCRGTRMRVYE